MIATTTVDIFPRDPDASDPETGDPTEGVLPKRNANPVPASLIERRRKVFMQETETMRTIRFFEMLVRSHVDIEKNDRVRDTRSGLVYVVDELDIPTRGLAGHLDTIVELRRLGNV